jgi:hypothetical protein
LAMPKENQYRDHKYECMAVCAWKTQKSRWGQMGRARFKGATGGTTT